MNKIERFLIRIVTVVVSFMILGYMTELYESTWVMAGMMSILFGMLIDNKIDIDRKSSKSGFTLIELLVVMVIIVILAGMMMPAIRKSRSKAIINLAESEMAAIASSISIAKLDCGYYVQIVDLSNIDQTSVKVYGSDGVLQDQVAGETEITHWEPPYLISRNNWTDPWGRQYRLEYIATEKCMSVVSAGPDGDFEKDEDNLIHKFF